MWWRRRRNKAEEPVSASPSTEEQIEELMKRFEAVNTDYIRRIAEQIKTIGELNPTSINRLKVMSDMNANMAEVNRELAETLRISTKELFELYDRSLNDTYKDPRFADALKENPLPDESKGRLEQFAQAVSRQTAGTMQNLSNTTASSAQYAQVIDRAVLAVSSGIDDYQSAVRDALRQLGENGMQCVYESGYRRSLDTAIRQNVIDGANQIAQHSSDMMGEELGFDAYEISAHANSAPDHEPVQGRVLLKAEYEKMQDGLDFVDVDGRTYKGFRRPVGQWNCKHLAMSFSTRHSIRRYTDEQLQKFIDDNARGCVIDGKHYTGYQATQYMRRLETQIRKEKRAAMAAETAGDDVLRQQCQQRINALSRKYNEVAKAAGLRPQRQRMSVDGLKAINGVGNPGGTGSPLTLSKNIPRDSEQYGRYRAVLGDEAPKTLEEFIQIKYTNDMAYGRLKYMYRIVNQYECNSGTMSASDIVRLHEDAVAHKALFNSYGRNGSTMGVMEIDDDTFYANSRASHEYDNGTRNYKGDKGQIVQLLPEDKRRFKTTDLDHTSHNRCVDAEAKLLERAAQIADDGKPHTIKLFSERSMCDSCKGVLEQFIKNYPNVTIEAVSHKKDKADKANNRNPVFEYDLSETIAGEKEREQKRAAERKKNKARKGRRRQRDETK